MDASEKQKIIDHMFNSACGFGFADWFDKQKGKDAFEKCMLSIPDEHFEEFIYTLYRIAEKSGYKGFTTH